MFQIIQLQVVRWQDYLTVNHVLLMTLFESLAAHDPVLNCAKIKLSQF